jgi:acyl-CoA synthetase (AMP-forming)/AMP-acid ligase II
MADFQLSRCSTEWVLLTSGTTGLPKMVAHSLGSLTAAISATKIGEKLAVWGTFYDVRRYGGLQVLFRVILGGGSFVLSSSGESLSQYLDRLWTREIWSSAVGIATTFLAEGEGSLMWVD